MFAPYKNVDWGFNSTHPESDPQLEEEFFTNLFSLPGRGTVWQQFERLPYADKRMGNQAHDSKGNPLDNGVPVFVHTLELQIRGLYVG